MRHCAYSTISLSAQSSQSVTAYGIKFCCSSHTTFAGHSTLEALTAHMLVYGSTCNGHTVHMIRICKDLPRHLSQMQLYVTERKGK